MNGSTYKRSKGDWSWMIYLGKFPNGKQHRISKSGFATKREADQAKQAKLQELQDEAAIAAGAPKTLGQLITVYIQDHCQQRCANKTVERYRDLMRLLDADLLQAPLEQLSTLQLEREFERMKASGGRNRETKAPRPLSPKTVRHAWGLVSAAINNGIRLAILKVNAATHCHLPALEKKEAKSLDAVQIDFFISAASGTYMAPILTLAAATGLRRGELLALTWPDFDPIRKTLAITKSLEQTRGGLRIKAPKNGKPRMVSLPDIAVEALEAHRADQAHSREAFGPGYLRELELIFADFDGSYRRPSTVSSGASRMAASVGLKGIGLHSLRHTHGSQLLSAGVPLPAVSTRLGHSSPRITAEVYAHAMPADETAAAAVWNAIMRPILKPASGAGADRSAAECSKEQPKLLM